MRNVHQINRRLALLVAAAMVATALLAAVGAATYLGTGFLLRLRSFREALSVGRLLLSTASPSSSA